ncbi:MAG: DUF1800 domain-containing protein [Paracoccaceae bacterium]|nr:DUF1800 domain-containing protein [Paracoccaceae bacterium]
MSDQPTLAAIRFGHGLPLPVAAMRDPAAMLAALSGPDKAAKRWRGVGMAQALPLHLAAAKARKLAREGDAERKAYRAQLTLVNAQATEAARVTIARGLGAADGFRERLVRFWADHFTTVARFRQDRVLPLVMIEDAIRPHVAGRFGDMLVAATLHPAMVLYLDQGLSIGPNSPKGRQRKRGLNENFARELIELHTLGAGAGYDQQDVRQLAELLTGVQFEPGLGFVFDPQMAEPGAETVLGRVYGGEGLAPVLAVLNDLAVRPETARHIARKLAVHFISDTPDEALVAHLEAAFMATGGDLLAVYAAFLEHPAAWAMPLAKARQPYDFMLASLRTLGFGAPEVLNFPRGPFNRLILGSMQAMGQPWNTPRGPDGWPEAAEAWITPQGLAARITWAMDAPGRLLDTLPEPDDLATRALGPLVGAQLRWAISASENRREAVGLILASPEFNRR